MIAAIQSTDGYTGTMPIQVAEILGWPSVSFAKHVEISDGVLKVQRQTEAAYDEITCPLPAVVTVTAGVVEPRYPSFKSVVAARSKPIEELTVLDLGLDPSVVGFAGARQRVVFVEAAKVRDAGEIVIDQDDGHERVVDFLEQLKIL
jgi:electron transfer flavoprotein beta subunit